MTWLADLLGIRDVYKDGVALATRSGIEFIGSAWSVQDNPATQRTEVRFTPASVDYKESVRLATTAALPANTRAGNVLTADANGALAAIDGVTPSVDDRLLVRNEALGQNNGLYSVTDAGSGSTPWVLTRTIDADESAEVTSGMTVPVTEGATYGDKTFRLTTNDPIVLNTTALQFSVESGLTAPVSGTEDTRIAYGSAGDLAYATGVRAVNSGASLAVGVGTLPTAGELRVVNPFGLVTTDSGSADTWLLYFASDILYVGDDPQVDTIQLLASTNHQIVVNGTTELEVTATLVDCKSNEIRTTGYLSINGTGVASGAIRLGNLNGITSETAGGTDLSVVYSDSVSDLLVFGDDNANTRIRADGYTVFYIASSPTAYIGTDGVTGFYFDSGLSSPVIFQGDDTTGSATGDTLTVHAQNCTGTTSTGGDLHLLPGTGTSTGGELELQDSGGTARFTVDSAGELVGNAASQWVCNVNSAAVLDLFATEIRPYQDIAFGAPVASPTLSQKDDATASVTGDTLSVHAQDCTGTTSTGGALKLRAGTGTSTKGVLELDEAGGTRRIAIAAGGAIELGAGTVAGTGDIRLPNAVTVYGRDSTTNDAKLIEWTSGDNLVFGEDTHVDDIQYRCSGAAYFMANGGSTFITLVGSSISLGQTYLQFDNSLSPILRQSTVGVGSGRLFSLYAQDCTTGTGGHMWIRGGDASGAGTGGDLRLEGGQGGSANGSVQIKQPDATTLIEVDDTGIGFFGATPIAKPDVSGSKASNAALADLCTELANLGLITDSTS